MEGYGCCLCWLPMVIHSRRQKQHPGPRSQERATQTNRECATQTDEETLEQFPVVDGVVVGKGAVAEAGLETAGRPTSEVWACCGCGASRAGAEEELIIPAKQKEMGLPVLLDQPAPKPACGKDNAEFSNYDACSTNNEETRPNFTGVWHLDRTERYSEFLKAIGLSSFLAAAASSVPITYTMEHKGDDMSATIELKVPSWPRLPMGAPPKRLMALTIGAPEILMMDDAGREFMMLKPTWEGAKVVAGIEYLKLPHKFTTSRYMEEGCMVEHMHYPSKGLEMRRIFRRVA